MRWWTPLLLHEETSSSLPVQLMHPLTSTQRTNRDYNNTDCYEYHVVVIASYVTPICHGVCSDLRNSVCLSNTSMQSMQKILL